MARGPARHRVRQKTRVFRIEPLKCDTDALKQECRLARITCSGTQPPTHLSEKIQRTRSYIAPEFRTRLVQKESAGGDKNTWPPSERLLLLIRQYLACRRPKPKLQAQVTTDVTVRQTSNDCVNKKVFKRRLKVGIM